MVDKLKPCPFCGADTPAWLESGSISNPFMWWDSGLRGEECGYVICYGCHAMIKANTEEDAVKAWNRRTDKTDV